MKRLLRHPRTLALGAGLLGAYLRFALRTTRWTLQGRDEIGALLLGGPAIFAFWHERLPLMPALWTLALRERGGERGRMHVLVSRHGDGRLIGRIMGGFGVETVHGSTARGAKERGGVAALRALITVLRRGDQVVLTPDGPRGPKRRAVPGILQLSALTAAPIVPCAAQTSRKLVLRTWDRMLMPLPFGRGVLVCGAPITVPRHGWDGRLPEIEAALSTVAERADRLCGA